MYKTFFNRNSVGTKSSSLDPKLIELDSSPLIHSGGLQPRYSDEMTRKEKRNEISTPTSSHSVTLSRRMHHAKNPKKSSTSNERTRNSHGRAGDEWLHFVVALARSKLRGQELVE
jgi:hypothetical protein